MTNLSGDHLERQRQIWTNLYGPAKATELLERAAAWAGQHPELSAAEVFHAVDPDDEDTYTNFVATRW